MSALRKLVLLLLVVSVSFCTASTKGDDQDTFQSRRELISVSPSSGLSPTTGMGYASAGGGANGFLGSYGQLGSGSGMVMPYGGSLPIPHYSPMIPPTPLTRQSPPPPPPPTASSYSASATVPGVKSTATLTSYATVAAFNATERTRFIATLEGNIFTLLKVVANVTIDSVVASSVSVSDTIAFTGSDSAAAAEARDALVTALNSGDTSVFGTSFGSIKVTGVTATNTTNPATKSGASSKPWTLFPMAATVFVGAAALYVYMP